jgi:signal transduction histidine kinase
MTSYSRYPSSPQRPDKLSLPHEAIRADGGAGGHDPVNGLLEIVNLQADGAPLSAVLDAVMAWIGATTGAQGSIWLPSDDGTKLCRATKPGGSASLASAADELPVEAPDGWIAGLKKAGNYGPQNIGPVAWAKLLAGANGEPRGVLAIEEQVGSRPSAADLEAFEHALPLVRLALDRDRLARSLAHSENRFGSVVANLPGVIYQRVVRPDGDIYYTYISEGSRELFGVSPEEILADPQALFRHHAPEYAASFRDRLLAASRELKIWDVDATIVTRSGEKKFTHAIARPTLMPDGSVVWDGMILDATRVRQSELIAHKAARDEAEAASRAKSAFLANMSHELRTPLNAVIGFADVMSRELMGPLGHPKYVDYVHAIQSSGTLLLNLINEVLDLARIEHNKLELDESPVSLADIMDVCVRMVEQKAKESHLKIEIMKPQHTPSVQADERRLKQVLLNLLTNAIKFTPAGGTVTVAVRASPSSGVVIDVKDTGIGIAAADIAHALQPFHQIDAERARKHGGAGLGLPLSKALIELHGGTLAIDSAPGIGTTISVTLPASRLLHG